MNIPTFVGDRSLYRTSRQYRTGMTAGAASSPQVVAQDCGFWTGLGCSFPMSWCFCEFLPPDRCADCLLKMNFPGCLPCLGFPDPRDRPPEETDRPTPDPSVGGGRSPGGSVGGGVSFLTQGTADASVPPELQKQLDRIERCACGIKFIETVPLMHRVSELSAAVRTG